MVIHPRTRGTERTADRGGILPLRREDVAALPLSWRHKLSYGEIRDLVRAFPGRSVYQPHTGHFALIGPWRHRLDIVQVIDVSAWSAAQGVFDGAATAAGQLGADLAVVVENDERRRPSLYASYGLEHIEDVITMELDRPAMPARLNPRLRFVPVLPGTPDLPAIRLVDDLAFPWLWRNGSEEFGHYLAMDDVHVFLGLLDDEPVSYFGVTVYDGWGHLDRIAVRPDLQGQGVGSATLGEALSFLIANGARSVGLSTQAHNEHSRRLYERFGFVRLPQNDYRIYGRALGGQSLDDLLARPPIARSRLEETPRP
ncbi:MAG TPA: GNAT family N-acetyltransferase [Thermomicrobiales bacterium]|jgi:ribosomal protein S18 acetylase RimI-like enzyme|nr:GNAT family N-acetyltransferase [Thermomicrobiales bacterium]